jgi:hypothetical protein
MAGLRPLLVPPWACHIMPAKARAPTTREMVSTERFRIHNACACAWVRCMLLQGGLIGNSYAPPLAFLALTMASPSGRSCIAVERGGRDRSDQVTSTLIFPASSIPHVDHTR